MPLSRRELLLATSGLAAACAHRGSPLPVPHARIRAVAVDAFVLFDPRPFGRMLEELYPGQGAAMWAGFRGRLFQYGWLRALGRRYQDFWRLSEDALDATGAAQGVALGPTRAALLDAWGSLPPWPDAVDGVRRLSGRGLEVAVLSNWSPRMVDDALARSGLAGVVRSLSTDAAQTYKPDPRAYRLALEAFGRSRGEILFVAFAGWDAAGASWFGFPTVWMNREGAAPDPLDLEGVRVAKSFDDLTLSPAGEASP